MDVVFQEFVLDLGEGDDEESPQSIPDGAAKWDACRRALIREGYTVLPASKHFCGVPARVIVGPVIPVPSSSEIKMDFYRITKELELPFESGSCFFREEQPIGVP